MRILHVITALGVGGAERMLMKLLTSRAFAGDEQQVVAMLPGGAMAPRMRQAGATVHELDFLGGLPVVQGAWQLRRLARRFAPDLVQGWMYHGNLGAAIARGALSRRVPLVWGIRQSLPSLAGENLFARIGIRLNRLASAHPDRLLFNSRTSMAHHEAAGFRMTRAAYVPNGFETAAFAPDPAARARLRAEWGFGDDEVAFGLLARHHPVKDHAGFLQAARLAVDARPACRFVLAGRDVDAGNAALAQVLSANGLAPHVRLLGERSDVADVLSALDVSVSSSTAEAFSNSIGEAMSCALPCIVTDVGESAAIVGDTGRVVPPRDPPALAEAMVAMADLGPAGRRAIGDRARARIAREFDIEAVARQYAALYAALVAEAR